MHLTIVVDREGHVGSDDVIETDLAVLWRAVGIQSFNAHDSVKQTPFWDWGLITTLDEHGGKLIDVIHTNMHSGPVGGSVAGGSERQAGEIGKAYFNNRQYNACHYSKKMN